MRHRSQYEAFPFIASHFSDDKPYPETVAEQSSQSIFNRQVTDEDVIGMAVSNEPVKHSRRAMMRGLSQGLGPLTLENVSYQAQQ